MATFWILQTKDDSFVFAGVFTGTSIYRVIFSTGPFLNMLVNNLLKKTLESQTITDPPAPQLKRSPYNTYALHLMSTAMSMDEKQWIFCRVISLPGVEARWWEFPLELTYRIWDLASTIFSSIRWTVQLARSSKLIRMLEDVICNEPVSFNVCYCCI